VTGSDFSEDEKMEVISDWGFREYLRARNTPRFNSQHL